MYVNEVLKLCAAPLFSDIIIPKHNYTKCWCSLALMETIVYPIFGALNVILKYVINNYPPPAYLRAEPLKIELSQH